jgi:hypothetical protein
MIDHRGMKIRQLKIFVIEKTLAYLGQGLPGFNCHSAVELLLGTIAQESQFEFLDQVTGPNDTTLGPAIGPYELEPATTKDNFDNFLNFPQNRALCDRVMSLLAARPSMDEQLATNWAFATAMARIKYWRSSVPLAAPGDVAGHAHVWKQVYNTPQGAGTEAQFIANYERLVAPYL